MSEIAIANGGLLSRFSNLLTAVPAGLSGQVLQSNGSGLPSWVDSAFSPPSHYIVSCPEDANGQSDFLRPLGGGADDVVLDQGAVSIFIKGSTYTQGGQVIAGLNAPVSTTSSAQVNVALAGDDQWTQIIGENGFDLPYDTGGANFLPTGQEGKLNAFKVVGTTTEYFIGRFSLGSTATSGVIKNCYRGYFRNSSGAAIPRAGITDNDVITIQKLHWIFFSGDQGLSEATDLEPIYSHDEPTSPSEGQRWFDTVNNTWKQYTSGAFSTVSQCLIGMCVVDENDAVVGARSFEAWTPTSESNTLGLVDFNSTKVRGQTNSEINVLGRLYKFTGSAPEWDITNTDIRVGTEDASTVYTLYVSNTGQLKMEATYPYWREDFLGYYHPYKPWRAVGYAFNNASSNLASIRDYKQKKQHDKILSSTVTGDGAIAGLAISNLIPGLMYEYDLTCVWAMTSTGSDLILTITHDGTTLGVNEVIQVVNVGSTTTQKTSFKFRATDTSIAVTASGAGGSPQLVGGSGYGVTWTSIREIFPEDKVSTTQY